MLFRKKCGIDLGSDTIKIADKKNKKVVCEKNMIAVRDKTYVIAVGQRAYEMYEKTPLCVTADSPMVNGAIADGRNLGFILARLLKRFSSVFTKRPDILVTVPMELSEIEMRAFYKVLTGLKVRRIALVEKGVADAVGIGMPVLAQTGSMVVNIGASTTGISVISDGKVIIGRQYPYGGNAMDQAVITMVRREHNLAIGKKTAEKLRVAMGCLMNGSKEQRSLRYPHDQRSPKFCQDTVRRYQQGDNRYGRCDCRCREDDTAEDTASAA